jgi:hypothetical protein
MTYRPFRLLNNHQRIQEVYSKTEEYLEGHPEIKGEIANYWWAYYEALDIVPQTLDNFMSGHFFPFAESHYELENSLQLCMEGFYRHSLFALRCVLELGVIGLYFDKDDKAHIEVQEWFYSNDPTPYFKKSLDQLFTLEYYQRFDKEFGIHKEINELYDQLSDFVHVRGVFYSSTGQSQSNINQFNEKSFLRNIDLFKKVVKNIIEMMLLKYPLGMQGLPLWKKFGLNPPAGGLIEEHMRLKILAVLEEDVKKLLQDISDNDPHVQQVIKHINSLPDMTEEDCKKQSEEWDKEMEGYMTYSPEAEKQMKELEERIKKDREKNK